MQRPHAAGLSGMREFSARFVVLAQEEASSLLPYLPSQIDLFFFFQFFFSLLYYTDHLIRSRICCLDVIWFMSLFISIFACDGVKLRFGWTWQVQVFIFALRCLKKLHSNNWWERLENLVLGHLYYASASFFSPLWNPCVGSNLASTYHSLLVNLLVSVNNWHCLYHEMKFIDSIWTPNTTWFSDNRTAIAFICYCMIKDKRINLNTESHILLEPPISLSNLTWRINQPITASPNARLPVVNELQQCGDWRVIG